MKKQTFRPKDKEELQKVIKKEVKQHGPQCDLNHIDTSLITDMSDLFYNSNFKGDISKWEISSVLDMKAMFAHSKFNGDISKWDTSKVLDMRCMFYKSVFTGDISQWNTASVSNMISMFERSKFNGDISKWDVGNVAYMSYMFSESGFNQSVDGWSPYRLVSSSLMVYKCAALKPAWCIKDKEQRDLYLRSRDEQLFLKNSIDKNTDDQFGICKNFKL